MKYYVGTVVLLLLVLDLPPSLLCRDVLNIYAAALCFHISISTTCFMLSVNLSAVA